MRKWTCFLACFFGMRAASIAQTGTVKHSNASSKTTRQLLLLEQRWNDAIVNKDTAFIKNILDTSFRYIAPDGIEYAKAQILQNIVNPDLVVLPFHTKDVVVRVFNKTAILTGTFMQTFTFRGKTSTMELFYTDVYTKKHKTWVAVSAQASLITK